MAILEKKLQQNGLTYVSEFPQAFGKPVYQVKVAYIWSTSNLLKSSFDWTVGLMIQSLRNYE